MEAEQPIRGIWYVHVEGPTEQLKVFCREAAKLEDWALTGIDSHLHIARCSAGPDETAEAAHSNASTLLWAIRHALALEGEGPLSGLKCGSAVRFRDGGGKDHAVFITETLTLKVTMGVVRVSVSDEHGKLPEPDPTTERINSLVNLAPDEAIKLALDLFESDADRWTGLYSIIEIVERELGEIPGAWISKTKLDLLKRTANSPTVAGRTSRHQNAKGQIPPPKPMPLDVAREHVRSILREFIRVRSGKL